MIAVDVIILPSELATHTLVSAVAVVLDVLRATTTMAAAMGAGVKEIQLFSGIGQAKEAAEQVGRSKVLLCGESKCRKPDGFDLGNSPGGFNARDHAGATVYMATTNGTRAMLAAGSARAAGIIPAALVNAGAAADLAHRLANEPGPMSTGPLRIILLCAGTDGLLAMEDLLGAGAVAYQLCHRYGVVPVSDTARLAIQFFADNQNRLKQVLAESQGGQNVIAAGLGEDVDFAARLDAIDKCGWVEIAPKASAAPRIAGGGVAGSGWRLEWPLITPKEGIHPQLVLRS